MNPIIKFLKESKTVLFFRIITETFRQAVIDSKYIANSDRYKTPAKLQSDLAIRIHAVEKGMSIGGVKVGFGRSKAISIIEDLHILKNIGGDYNFIVEACSVLNQYINFNEKLGADMYEVKKSLQIFISRNTITLENVGGIYCMNFSKDIEPFLNAPFRTFSQTRFSIRDLEKTPVNKSKLEEAFKICERTPSACNRQSWRVHVYEGDLKDKMCKLQGGSKGFFEDFQYAILICGDQRYYNINELHQVYVDGGLYAMNLIYALHAEGLATIPLTMGHKTRYTAGIKKAMNIPDYELPVVLIGVGSYKEEYKVAASVRNDYKKYVTFEK